MKHNGRLFFSFLLALTMVVGLMPGMSLTAYAYDGNPYASLVNSTTTVSFNGKPWYIIADNSTAVDAGTVTLLAADTSFGTSKFHDSSNAYSSSTVKGVLDALTAEGGAFADVKDAIADTDLSDVGVTGAKLYLLSTEEANSLPENVRKAKFTGGDCFYNEWWLRSPGLIVNRAAYVVGFDGDVDDTVDYVGYAFGVRPALKLNLESVSFSSESQTFTMGSATSYSVTVTAGSNMTKTGTSGAASQTDLSGAMTDVVYTANEGYYFPTDYSVAAVNGISVTRDSYTQITVSGTPSADAEITLTAPTAKTTPDAPTAASTDCTTADNNDGKLTGVTTAMEYKKSDAADWTAGTGSDITGLVPGTYYVRVKATDTTNASANQELTIKGFISYTVTFKVVNGKWNEGEGDAATADKTVTLTGHDGDTLKLTAAQIPAVGDKPNDTYKAGNWDVMPNTDTAITEATTYTYTYVAKEASVVTKAPEAKTLTYNGQAQELVTAGTATGGEMQYALGNATEVTGDYTPSIPTASDAGTYYVWYKVVGDENHSDSEPKLVLAMIADTLVYNGAQQALVEGASVAGGELQYAVGDDDQTVPAEGWSTEVPTRKDAGTYPVWYQVVGDENHNGVDPVCVSVTIAKAPLTVTAEAKAKVEGEADPALTYTTSGLLGDDQLTGALTRDPGEAPGEYAITLGTLTAGDNYILAFNGAKLTITAKPADPTPTPAPTPTATPTVAPTVEPTVEPTQAPANGLLMASMKASGKTVLKFKWNAVADAEGYDVFLTECGQEHYDLVASVGAKTRAFTAKGLKKFTTYKGYVRAWRTVDGTKTYIAESPRVHALTGNNANKYTNAKSVSVKKTKVKLAVGKTAKISASVKKVKNSLRLMNHEAKLRYYTSDPSVATVSASGKIKAVGTGKCKIYVVAVNGIYKTVTVTVK